MLLSNFTSSIVKPAKHSFQPKFKLVAIHSNTSVAMINKHYQDLSDDNLVKIHNQLFPERTTNHKNNIKTKK